MIRTNWRQRAPFYFLAFVGLILLALATGCGPARQGGDEPAEAPATAEPAAGKAYVDTLQLHMLESFPVQVRAEIGGNLSDGCTTIAEIWQERVENTFNLEIVTERPADAVCTEALVPFTEMVHLEVEGLPAGPYTVNVDGQTATFDLPVDNILPEEPAEEPVTEPVEEPASPAAGAAPPAVVYDDGSLWLWQAGEAPRQLSETGNVNRLTISDDGQRIVYERDGALWAVNADGSDARQLLEPAALASLTSEEGATVLPDRLGWLPGSHTLLFNTYLHFEEGIGLYLSDDLHALDVDAGTHRLILPPGEGGDFYPSPDDSQVALVTPSAIHLADIDGSDRRQLLAYEPVITYSEYQYYAIPTWDPDRASLWVAIPPADPLAQPPAPTTVWQLHVDGTAAQMVGELDAVNTLSGTPALSPGASHVAFVTPGEEEGDGRNDLQIVPLSPAGLGEPQHYATDVIHFAEWAPDGRHFTYSSGPFESPVVMLGGLETAPVQIGENGGTVVEAEALPAGQLLFLQEREGSLLLALRHAGGAVEVIAEFGAERGIPLFAHTR